MNELKEKEKKGLKVFALSTKDNPFNPFTEFEKWYAFDHSHGYNSSEYLARLAHTSPYEPPEQTQSEIEAAIDDIIRLDPLKIYTKVSQIVE